MIHLTGIERDGCHVEITTTKYDVERTFDSEEDAQKAIDRFEKFSGSLDDALDDFQQWNPE